MVQPAGHVVYAIHEYEIPGKGFLPLRAGDVLYVLDADESGWWLGVNLRREKGVFPSTYTLPYVYPQPPPALMRDARLLRLARDFDVDISSGAPSPLVAVEAASSSASSAQPAAEDLCEELQRLLLEREDARRSVMDRLRQLLDAQGRRQAAQEAAAAVQQVRLQQADAAEERLRNARQELHNVAEALRQAKKTLLLARGVAPSFSWYERLAAVMGSTESAAEAAAAISHGEGVWREAVRDVKGIVEAQEKELAAMSTSAAEKEAAFTEAAAALQTRIEWRDSNVAAMLAHWADASSQAKSAYITRKAERDAAAVVHQQEAAQLRRRLEEGKTRFAAVKAEHRRLKRKAQFISDTLKQQSALDALSAEVAQLDRQIAAQQTS